MLTLFIRIISMLFITHSLSAKGMIDRDLLERAKSLPSRANSGYHSAWNCGPDALARFFILANVDSREDVSDIESYCSFTKNCPRSFGKPVTPYGYAASATLLATSTSSFYSGDVVTGLVTLACGTAPFIFEACTAQFKQGNVGPTPRWLAGYGNSVHVDSIATMMLDEKDKVIAFIEDEIDNNRPVIVLVNYSPLAWHYYTIVGYSDDDFTYLDERAEGTIPKKNLMTDMDFHKAPITKAIKNALATTGWILNVDIGRFNLIHLRDPN